MLKSVGIGLNSSISINMIITCCIVISSLTFIPASLVSYHRTKNVKELARAIAKKLSLFA